MMTGVSRVNNMSMDLLLSVYPNSINRHSTNKTIKYRIKHCGLDFEEK